MNYLIWCDPSNDPSNESLSSFECGVGRRRHSSLRDDDMAKRNIELPGTYNAGSRVETYLNEHHMHLEVEDDIDQIPDEPPGSYISFKTLLAYLGPVS